MHVIRLRHPWKCEPCGNRTLWHRSFNWPPGNATDEIVSLVIEPCSGDIEVQLNGQPLVAADGPGRFLVNAILKDTNRLEVSLASTESVDGQFPLQARLEIDDS